MKDAGLTALLPLEPPPPPAPSPWQHALPVTAALLLALALAWWWHRPARRQRRRLQRLQRRLALPGCDTRILAAELEQLLRSATGRSRLDDNDPPAGLATADWHALLQILQQARFDRRSAAADELAGWLPMARRALGGRRDAA